MTSVPAYARGAWFGQPRGLTVLFLTEMWEKFSFFGMRALLIYYMTKALHFPQSKASLIYGLYTAFIYFTPILGGAISDRWLSRKTAVVIGGSAMAAGHFMLAWPPLFYPALVTIALGNGLYLPNLPSQIPWLFAPDDPRRGSAFSVYYVGVNLGAFLAPLVCGTLGETLGWHWGFAAAGCGMVLGLLTYVAGGRLLPPEPARDKASKVAAAGAPDRRAFGLLLAVGLAVVVFRGAYEQVGNTVALWADADVNRRAAGFLIPASWFQSLNALMVFLLTPLLVRAWTRQAKQGREPSPVAKMTMGAFGLAAAYAAVAGVAAIAARQGAQPGWVWLAAFIGLLTAAELFILPIGLGLFARLAPASWGATTIAAWFLASFAGNLLAGALGAAWGVWSHAAFFAAMAGVAALSAAALWALVRPARGLEPPPPPVGGLAA